MKAPLIRLRTVPERGKVFMSILYLYRIPVLENQNQRLPKGLSRLCLPPAFYISRLEPSVFYPSPSISTRSFSSKCFPISTHRLKPRSPKVVISLSRPSDLRSAPSRLVSSRPSCSVGGLERVREIPRQQTNGQNQFGRRECWPTFVDRMQKH